jgi:hypothetical protein
MAALESATVTKARTRVVETRRTRLPRKLSIVAQPQFDQFGELQRRSTTPPLAISASLPAGPTRPVPRYAPHFVPFLAGGEPHLTYSAPFSTDYHAFSAPPAAYQLPTGAPPFYNVAPQPAYQQPVWQSVPHPFPGGLSAASGGAAFPRTGLTGYSGPGVPTAAPIRRPSTFPSPLQVGSSGFVPVQPAKPLLIDDFLSLNALNALKHAPGRLMIDSQGSTYVQINLFGVSTRKIKCPNLPAWLKASEKIKSALVTMRAIRGPDYDRYFDSCMTLLLDPKCGGNGWSLKIFFEFDNAHRLQQWHTGSKFDVICPLRMAHFAAISASSKLTPTFLSD